VVGAADPALLEPQGLDGAAALDRLGDPAGQPRPGGHLAPVAVGGAPQVPAGREPQQRQHDQHRRQRDPGRHSDRGGDGQGPGDDGDQGLGHAEAHHLGDVLDVAGGAGDQVAGAGRLDRAQGEAEHAVQELLAQLGQHPLAEGVGGQPAHPVEHHLGDQGGQHGQGDLVHPPGGGAATDLVDQQAEQGRAGQPGQGGGGVQADRQRQAPAVPPGQRPGPGPDLDAGGHRQPGHRGGGHAHGSSSRVTTAR
jgi:hypothetical protein